jgi:hypothetical protein
VESINLTTLTKDQTTESAGNSRFFNGNSEKEETT